jgi:hypothetical protein
MPQGLKIGDEVVIHATVLERLTDDRVSVSIPSYNFPHLMTDKSARKGQHVKLIGNVAKINGDKVTIKLGRPTVTVNADTVTLSHSYVPPKRTTPRTDEPT